MQESNSSFVKSEDSVRFLILRAIAMQTETIVQLCFLCSVTVAHVSFPLMSQAWFTKYVAKSTVNEPRPFVLVGT
jgi:hypothetical protein